MATRCGIVQIMSKEVRSDGNSAAVSVPELQSLIRESYVRQKLPLKPRPKPIRIVNAQGLFPKAKFDSFTTPPPHGVLRVYKTNM